MSAAEKKAVRLRTVAPDNRLVLRSSDFQNQRLLVALARGQGFCLLLGFMPVCLPTL